MGARQMRIQTAAIHGRLASLRRLAGGREYRGGHRRLQRLSRAQPRRLGARPGAADRLGTAARAIRRQRPRTRGAALRDARSTRRNIWRCSRASPPDPSRSLPPRTGYPSRHASGAYLSNSESLHVARRNWIPASGCWTILRTSGPTGSNTGRSANFCWTQPLDEEAFYGFLSPKFRLKTNLTAAAGARVHRARTAGRRDVFLFSPSIHNSAYYLNVFEHGESEHPGLAAVAARFFARIDRGAELDDLVSDSRNTVHSNYFIAKPRFWRAWLAINERLFAIAEIAGRPRSASSCARPPPIAGATRCR